MAAELRREELARKTAGRTGPQGVTTLPSVPGRAADHDGGFRYSKHQGITLRAMIAGLFHVHGNFPALEAVLSHAKAAGAVRVVVGGDIVDGPLPRQTLDRLLTLRPMPLFIRGNTERAVVAGHNETGEAEPGRPTLLQQWVAAQLTPGQLRFLAGLPRCTRLDTAGARVLFCHATPRSDREVFTPATPSSRHHVENNGRPDLRGDDFAALDANCRIAP